MNKMLGLAVATAVQMTSSAAFAERANQLSDERVRQAIAYAIDMDTIVETLFEGKAIAADSMILAFIWCGITIRIYLLHRRIKQHIHPFCRSMGCVCSV